MFVYLVHISADIPYPWPKRYQETAANEGTALSRALKKYRQDIKARNGKSRKLGEISLTVRRIRGADGNHTLENN